MKKIVKRWGNSLVVMFTTEERKIYGLKSGDFIDIEISKIRKKSK